MSKQKKILLILIPVVLVVVLAIAGVAIFAISGGEQSTSSDSTIEQSSSPSGDKNDNNGQGAIGGTDTVVSQPTQDENNQSIENGNQNSENQPAGNDSATGESISNGGSGGQSETTDMGFAISSQNYKQVVPMMFNAGTGDTGRNESIDYVLSMCVPLEQIPDEYKTTDNLVYFYYTDRKDAAISFTQQEVIDVSEPALVSNNGKYTVYKVNYKMKFYPNDVFPNEEIVDNTMYVRYDNTTKKIVEIR